MHPHHLIKSPHFLHHTVCNYTNNMMQFCCSSIFELEGAPHLLSRKTTRLGRCINWSKTKLMHVGDDLINCPSSLEETLLSPPCLSYTWAKKFPILVSSSQRSAEDMEWVQVSWDLWRLLWWHYKFLDAPSYKFIILSFSLYYYTATRHGLSVRPLPLTFMNYHSTGLILYLMRSSTRTAASWTSLIPSFNAVFAGLAMFCNKLMTILLKSCTSSICHMQTCGDLMADHAVAGRMLSTRTSSRLI